MVPADGRLLSAATLEIAESALTGESLPVSKGVEVVASTDTPLGRPHRHGVHEHERDPRGRELRRDDDGNGDRGRPHLRHAPGRGRRGHPAHDPAQEADEPDPLHRRRRGGGVDRPQSVAGRELRHRLHRRDRLRDLRDPDRAPRGRHDDPLVRHADAREIERDHEAASLDRDARVDLGDQLRQDRHAHAQPDDRRRARDPRAALHDLGRRLRDRRDDQARRSASRRFRSSSSSCR